MRRVIAAPPHHWVSLLTKRVHAGMNFDKKLGFIWKSCLTTCVCFFRRSLSVFWHLKFGPWGGSFLCRQTVGKFIYLIVSMVCDTRFGSRPPNLNFPPTQPKERGREVNSILGHISGLCCPFWFPPTQPKFD